jgi:mono/diheme cytochrome c family protein
LTSRSELAILIGNFMPQATPGASALLLLVAAMQPIAGRRPLLAQGGRAAAASPGGAHTAAQAARGEAVFRRVCAQCHVASQFTTDAFRASWRGRDAWELFELIRTTMPQDTPGRLRRQEYADLVAWVFQANGMPPGESELAPDSAALRRALFTPAATARP